MFPLCSYTTSRSIYCYHTSGDDRMTRSRYKMVFKININYCKSLLFLCFSRPRQNRKSLLGLSEKDLFMELIRDISNELDVNVLCHKILLNVSVLTKSDRGSLFLARGKHNKRYLVSKLFDVRESSSLEESLRTHENQIKVPFGKGIAGKVAETKAPINIKNCYDVSTKIH